MAQRRANLWIVVPRAQQVHGIEPCPGTKPRIIVQHVKQHLLHIVIVHIAFERHRLPRLQLQSHLRQLVSIRLHHVDPRKIGRGKIKRAHNGMGACRGRLSTRASVRVSVGVRVRVHLVHNFQLSQARRFLPHAKPGPQDAAAIVAPALPPKNRSLAAPPRSTTFPPPANSNPTSLADSNRTPPLQSARAILPLLPGRAHPPGSRGIPRAAAHPDFSDVPPAARAIPFPDRAPPSTPRTPPHAPPRALASDASSSPHGPSEQVRTDPAASSIKSGAHSSQAFESPGARCMRPGWSCGTPSSPCVRLVHPDELCREGVAPSRPLAPAVQSRHLFVLIPLHFPSSCTFKNLSQSRRALPQLLCRAKQRILYRLFRSPQHLPDGPQPHP